MLKLTDYEQLIELHTPFMRYTGKFIDDSTRYQETNELIKEIEKEIGSKITHIATEENKENTMTLIRSYLNQRMPEPISPRFLTLIDHYLADYRSDELITKLENIPTVKQSYPKSNMRNSDVLSLFCGDITLLECDAIVNAANDQMLGCFSPMHKCIDNCIHTFASPRLRDDMNKIMKLQKRREETGGAKITRAYNLPSKFVLHTVGPIYSEHNVEENNRLLSSCYSKCLDLASEVPECKSIAFCCISTGVFHFPNKKAAEIAIETTNDWIDAHKGRFERVVFNVFLQKDFEIYQSILSE
jgi:O-acetyl-ADP-ribose deacetylase (regulator of RNase III)